jgi:hypothetical protein
LTIGTLACQARDKAMQSAVAYLTGAEAADAVGAGGVTWSVFTTTPGDSEISLATVTWVT